MFVVHKITAWKPWWCRRWCGGGGGASLVFLVFFLVVFQVAGRVVFLVLLHFALLVFFIPCLGVFCLFPTHPHRDDRPLWVVRQRRYPSNVVLQQGFGLDQCPRACTPNSNGTVVAPRHVLLADGVRVNRQRTETSFAMRLLQGAFVQGAAVTRVQFDDFTHRRHQQRLNDLRGQVPVGLGDRQRPPSGTASGLPPCLAGTGALPRQQGASFSFLSFFHVLGQQTFVFPGIRRVVDPRQRFRVGQHQCQMVLVV